MELFASSVWNSNTLILSGGFSETKKNAFKVFQFTFRLDQQGSIVSRMNYLPPMLKPRYKHCQIIMRDILFVFFGHKYSMISFSDKLEYLDLKDPFAEFKKIKIKNYH